MANDLNRSIKIYIDGTEATNSVSKVESSIAKLEQQLVSLDRSEAGYAEKSKKLQQELNQKNKVLADYKTRLAETERVLNNLSGASYNKLLAVQKQVQRELRNAIPNTQQHTAALEQNRRVTEALTRAQAAMRVEVGNQGNVFSRTAGWINKYMVLFAGFIASITGISVTLRKCVNDFAQISEAMAGVKKYTGMADEEIKALNEDFKKMDTRTARERLNELAQDAGRLGIKGKKDILEFVEAADIINVALGEDLGEDAVKNMGKLATMFGEDKTLGLRGAMLATASAINEVAQNSSAAESYIVDFTAQVAGASNQAGIAQANLIGYASVLDENMLRSEKAATAFQKVMMKMYQEPAKLAKLAGVDVKQFTELLNKDANEALLLFFDALSKKGGLDELAPIFKELKLQGEGAASVLSVLAGKVDDIRSAQALANTAYRDGTSVIKEFDVQNNTIQAGLDKAKKSFQEISYELGERMTPYMSKFITTSGTLVRALTTVIGFLIEYSRTITTLVAIIGGYILISKGQIIEEKLKFFWQEKVIASLKRMYAVLIRHPYAAVAAAVIVLIAYLRDMNKELSDSERIEQSLSNIRNRAVDSIQTEKSEIEQLLRFAKDENKSKETREAAIRRLNEISPEYLGNLTLEKINTEEATKAINTYIDRLIVVEEIKNAQERIDELRNQRRKLVNEGPDRNMLQNVEANVASIMNKAKTSFVELTGLGNSFTFSWADQVIRSYKEAGIAQLQAIDNETDALNNHIVDKRNTLLDALNSDDDDEKKKKKTGGTGRGEENEKERKERLQAEKTEYARHQADLKERYLSGKEDELQTEKQYNKAMEQLQLDHLQRSIKIAGEKSSEAADFQNQINDIKIKQKKEALQEELDAEKLLYERQQEELKEVYTSGQDENLRTEAAYNDAMEQLTIMHLQRVLQIAGLNADERRKVEKQLLDFKVKCIKDEEKARTKSENDEQKRKDNLAKKEKQRLEQQAQEYRKYGEQIGESIGQLITKQENALASFADTMIDVLFDVLSQLIEIEIAKATGVAVGAVARASAESLAQADSVASFGATGAARAAILSGLIMGALAAAKSALKGLVKRGGGSSGSSSDDSNSPKTATVKVSQWETGRYDVIGKDDGKTYRNIPFLGPAQTGIVHRTSLVSENGAELIVNAEDLQRLQRHVNYPLVLQAINDARNNQVPQRASGNYSTLNDIPKPSPDNDGVVNMNEFLNELRTLLKHLRNIKAYVLLRDIDKAREIDNKSNDPFTRKKS